jgi:hypothetical protein
MSYLRYLCFSLSPVVCSRAHVLFMIFVFPSQTTRFTLHEHMGSPFTHTWVYPSRTPGFTHHEHMGSPFTNTCVHPSRTPGFTLHEHLCSPFTNTCVHPSRTSGFTLHEHMGSPRFLVAHRLSFMCCVFCFVCPRIVPGVVSSSGLS